MHLKVTHTAMNLPHCNGLSLSLLHSPSPLIVGFVCSHIHTCRQECHSWESHVSFPSPQNTSNNKYVHLHSMGAYINVCVCVCLSLLYCTTTTRRSTDMSSGGHGGHGGGAVWLQENATQPQHLPRLQLILQVDCW